MLALLDGKLILSDPSRFNDPFDLQLDVSLDKDDSNQPIPDCVGMLYRMICLSEKWDSLLMWGHYACRHKGICLQLHVDPSALPYAEDILEPVRYSTHYQNFTTDLNKGDLTALRTYLLTKSVDWLYEKEWRYITHCMNCQRDVVSGSDYVESSSFLQIKGVYLGVKFHDAMGSNNFWHRMQNQERNHHDTIFNLLGREDDASLDRLAIGDDGKVDAIKETAIGRERILREFQRRSIPVLGCRKKAEVFGLEHKPFEYNERSSLMVGCLEKPKSGEIRPDSR